MRTLRARREGEMLLNLLADAKIKALTLTWGVRGLLGVGALLNAVDIY